MGDTSICRIAPLPPLPPSPHRFALGRGGEEGILRRPPAAAAKSPQFPLPSPAAEGEREGHAEARPRRGEGAGGGVRAPGGKNAASQKCHPFRVEK